MSGQRKVGRPKLRSGDVIRKDVKEKGVQREEVKDQRTDMPPGTDCPYPIRILAFFEMIRPYHVVIRI